MTSSVLLSYIGHLWHIHAEYAVKLANLYMYGNDCIKEEKKFLVADWFITEIENYYLDCSCLTEEEVCELIMDVQKLMLE